MIPVIRSRGFSFLGEGDSVEVVGHVENIMPTVQLCEIPALDSPAGGAVKSVPVVFTSYHFQAFRLGEQSLFFYADANLSEARALEVARFILTAPAPASAAAQVAAVERDAGAWIEDRTLPACIACRRVACLYGIDRCGACTVGALRGRWRIEAAMMAERLARSCESGGALRRANEYAEAAMDAESRNYWGQVAEALALEGVQ